MAENFIEKTAATIYCVHREKDCKVLVAELKNKARESKATITDGSRHQCLDMGYCRVHVVTHKWPDGRKTNECLVANRRGETMAAGRNVANSQVAAFILRKFW